MTRHWTIVDVDRQGRRTVRHLELDQYLDLIEERQRAAIVARLTRKETR